MPPDDSPDDVTFTMTRMLKAPRARVWDAFAKPDQLAQWFGPPGVTVTILAHDLRPGGIVHYCMAPPIGPRMWGRSVYRELQEPERLVWVNSFADEAGQIARAPFFFGQFPLEMLTTITLDEVEDGTRLTLLWVPLDASTAERQVIAGNTASFAQGWGGSFDQLDRFLATTAA